MSENKKNFLDLYKESHYKRNIIDSLCKGIDNGYIHKFKYLLEYVIDKKYHLFDREEFKGALYLEEDETLDLILPTIKRAFGKVFINPPTLFKDSNNKSLSENKRYELFTMYFNIDEFINYLIDIFIKSKNCLHHFENIDRTAETLTLIVDNYIAGLVQRVINIDDHEQAIDNLLKQYKRDNFINQIIEENKDVSI